MLFIRIIFVLFHGTFYVSMCDLHVYLVMLALLYILVVDPYDLVSCFCLILALWIACCSLVSLKACCIVVHLDDMLASSCFYLYMESCYNALFIINRFLVCIV